MFSIVCTFFIVLSYNKFAFCIGSDGFESPISILRENGYPHEKHTIQTEDGYILTTYRVPHGIHDAKINDKPVLIHHGLVESSGDFLTFGPNRSLGFVLADNGYDVWLMNARGTTDSRQHIYIDEATNKAQFYNFSWHEIGLYDIPANIDYILNVTNKQQLHYVGHSQGGTSFLVMLSTKPKYNEKIRLASLFATSVFLIDKTFLPIVNFLGPYIDIIHNILNILAVYDIPYVDEVRRYLQVICKYPDFGVLCRMIYDVAGGYKDPEQTDSESIVKVFRTLPANAAVKQFIHYSKIQKTGKFCQFDYGRRKNIKVYGSELPPDYELKNVSAPITLYVGKNDEMVGIEGSKLLAGMLKNATLKIMDHDKWNHFDFLFAKDVVDLLYNNVSNEMNVY